MSTPLHITVPEPCHENWQQMTPNEQGRFCMSCQKTVVDFRLMSDQEILSHISRASGEVCGHFNGDQLNKTYAERTIKKRLTWKYAWNMLVASFLLAGHTVSAQGRVATKKPPVTVKKKKSDKTIQAPDASNTYLEVLGGMRIQPGFGVDLYYFDFKGLVADSKTNLPISNATISIKGEEGGTATNEEGVFGIKKKAPTRKLTLVTSAVGYETREYEINSLKPSAITIALKPQVEELLPVEVRGTSMLGTVEVKEAPLNTKVDSIALLNCLEGRVGEYIVNVSVNRKEKIKREIKEWLPKNDIKIYPNPIVPGNCITVGFNTKLTGHARIELLDAGGKLMWAQQLQNIESIQKTEVPTQPTWSKGIYWLRLTSPISKKVYNAKVLIQ